MFSECANYEILIFMRYLLLISLFIYISEAQVSKPDTLRANRVDNQIELDGRLDESAWENAQKITNFQQRVQQTGAPASQRTKTAVVYTKHALYVGAWCFDEDPSAMVAKQMKRDFTYWNEDNFVVIIDPYQSKRDGYIFAVNSNGAKSDVYSSDEAKAFNMDWNGIWEVETMQTDSGWFAEIKIPFSTLKFPEKEVHEWGINFQRRIRRTQEQAFWQGWNPDYNFEHVSHAGTLTGLKNIEGKETLEIKPYVTAGVENGAENETITKVGGDVNYLLTPTLKLNMTANTDFAQVESDRARINLTRFSLYYPEKRDFFLEGQSFFEFDMGFNNTLFYSRRIGLENGKNIPLLGGARLMGTAGDTRIGVMSIQTGAKNGIPTANFSTFRIKQNIFKKSYIGFIYSSKISEDVKNYNYGIDFNFKYSKLFGDKNIQFWGGAAQSLFQDEKNNDNYGYTLALQYPNDEIYSGLGFQQLKKNFNPVTGFVPRREHKLVYHEFVYKPRLKSSGLIQQLNLKLYDFQVYFNDKNGEIESFKYAFRPVAMTFSSGEYFAFAFRRKAEKLYEPFEIIDNIVIPEDTYWFNEYAFNFNTYQGRQLYINTNYTKAGFFNGDRQIMSASLGLNLGRHINLSADYTRNDISLPQDDFATDEIAGRFEYAFNPEMNTSLFGQWNNELDEMLFNFRFHWIPVPGSNIYFVLNQLIGTDGKIDMKDTAIMTKVVWRFGV